MHSCVDKVTARAHVHHLCLAIRDSATAACCVFVRSFVRDALQLLRFCCVKKFVLSLSLHTHFTGGGGVNCTVVFFRFIYLSYIYLYL